MPTSGSARSGRIRTLSRRSLLMVPGLSVLAMVACGDESSDRHFAGDPRTTQPGETSGVTLATPALAGSPTAVPTALSTSDLLAPRGDSRYGLVLLRHELIAIDSDPPGGRSIWSDDSRALWTAAVDPASERVALLTSAAKSAVDWVVEFIPISGDTGSSVPIGIGSDHVPDAVAEGRGGICWLPDSSSVVVSMPTGGLLQVFPDGSQIRLAKAAIAKRPGAVGLSPDGGAIAFVEQPSGSDGSGIYAGSMRAKPIDPIVVLPPDRSGNRSARGVQWIGSSGRLATIIERDELGSPQGDLFYLNVQNRSPQLAWTSPPGRDTASVEAFTISPDGVVTAFATNTVRNDSGKSSSIWVMQTDGPSIERFDVPTRLSEPRLDFAPSGLVVTGVAGRTAGQDGLAVGYLIAPNGLVSLLYEETPEATPVASPAGSPVASPAPSPVASPASPSPRAVTDEG